MKKISNIETKKLEDLYKLNKLDELEIETKKLLEIENNNIILLNILGVVYLKKNIFNKAELIFKKILSQNFNDANALKNLGETYRKINKISHAIKYYELYLKINSNDNEIETFLHGLGKTKIDLVENIKTFISRIEPFIDGVDSVVEQEELTHQGKDLDQSIAGIKGVLNDTNEILSKLDEGSVG